MNSEQNIEQVSDKEDINALYTAVKSMVKHFNIEVDEIDKEQVETINNILNQLGYEIKPKETDNRIDKLRKVLGSDYKGIIIISGHDEIGKHTIIEAMKNSGYPVSDIHPDNYIGLRDELENELKKEHRITTNNSIRQPESIPFVMKNYKPEYTPSIKELNTPFYEKIKTNKRNDKSNKKKRK